MRAASYLALLCLGGLADSARAESRPTPPIILISVDTLRADRLGCYGSRRQKTPNIDALANGGTLYSRVSAQVPLTLASHVSLLTSTYPFSNGIEDNGQIVPPQTVTLASVLKSRGYKTAAFIGGFVLDRRFGLDRGFDVYDSPFAVSAQAEGDASELKRLGQDVTRSAEDWIGKNSKGPFFVFLHLFDLHTPENLTPALRARFPGPRYESELAYVDEVLGGFCSFLGHRGLLDKALIVFLSDHGESLGEHGENTHGYFIYQSTMSVPLICHWPKGSSPMPRKIDAPVSLLGVAPAILQFAGIPRPPTFQGRSLPGVSPKPIPFEAQEIYGESLYSHHHFNTSALFSLRLDRYKFIQAPKPELYDLEADPGERNNLYASKPGIASEYSRRLQAIRARFASGKPLPSNAATPEVVAKLRSLGYLSGSAASAGSLESGPDPKDRIAEYSKYRHALALAASGAIRESNAILLGILSDHPGLLEVRNMLGLNQQRLGDHEGAIGSFKEVLKNDSLNAYAHLSLAASYSGLNRLDDAFKELQAALAIASRAGAALDYVSIPAREMLGAIWIQRNEYAKAVNEYTILLAAAPNNYEAHYNLAWLASRDGHTEEAERHLQAAVQSEPRSATAHNALGSVYLQRKELDRAAAEFLQAARLDPKLAFARYNLGLVLSLKNDRAGSAAEYREALKIDPRFQPARDALNRMGLN